MTLMTQFCLSRSKHSKIHLLQNAKQPLLDATTASVLVFQFAFRHLEAGHNLIKTQVHASLSAQASEIPGRGGW